MPNHVQTLVNLQGETKELIKLNKYVSNPAHEDINQRPFDFEKIIPMPAHIYRGNIGPKEEEKYGAENCWYKWSIKNWGTKWNCYEVNVDVGYFSFWTAWSFPEPILRKLSKKFPKIKFFIQYADEDLGSNVGDIIMQNGKVIEDLSPEEGTDEAVAFAKNIWNWEEAD